ncbi:XRE family aerobic/anaerobic benzoate catabolism transcriptional regulator [Variovorax sp. Sphag1AA]|nr:XRE family aerobic/anaerobic benzoate catabolism transcriptional regulator [Variovorax sp. Sphag1AA]
MTRKSAALATGISERYLASLECGEANPSLLVLGQLAIGLDCSVAAVVGDMSTASAEWVLIRDLLEGRSDAELRKARYALSRALGHSEAPGTQSQRIALVGLRGAGKSTLGKLLAQSLGFSFIELSLHIERMAGFSIREIHDLYGPNAYRRYERRALEEVLQIHSDCVIAVPGGVVAEPATFSLLLGHCWSIWLQASPEDHMARVARQGDLRPMAGNAEAMQDLRRILEGRSAFYAQADLIIDTSQQDLEETLDLLHTGVIRHLQASMSTR